MHINIRERIMLMWRDVNQASYAVVAPSHWAVNQLIGQLSYPVKTVAGIEFKGLMTNVGVHWPCLPCSGTESYERNSMQNGSLARLGVKSVTFSIG